MYNHTGAVGAASPLHPTPTPSPCLHLLVGVGLEVGQPVRGGGGVVERGGARASSETDLARHSQVHSALVNTQPTSINSRRGKPVSECFEKCWAQLRDKANKPT